MVPRPRHLFRVIGRSDAAHHPARNNLGPTVLTGRSFQMFPKAMDGGTNTERIAASGAGDRGRGFKEIRVRWSKTTGRGRKSTTGGASQDAPPAEVQRFVSMWQMEAPRLTVPFLSRAFGRRQSRSGAMIRAKLLRARFSLLLTVPRLHPVISAMSS